MMSVTLHGVRGSTPSNNNCNSRYGGNTSCFEVNTNRSQVFIDAGTGFISAEIIDSKKKVLLLFSHLHHDHVQGLLFNSQLFGRTTEIVVASGLMSGTRLKKHLTDYFSPPFFPPDVFATVKCFNFLNFGHAKKTTPPDLDIDCISLNHPGGAVGYSFISDGKKVVIALDNEFDSSQESSLLQFCENADLLIWDGMFTDEELQTKKGWGHSSVEQAEYFAQKSKVKRTIICHHAPTRSDVDIDYLNTKLKMTNVEFGKEKFKIVV